MFGLNLVKKCSVISTLELAPETQTFLKNHFYSMCLGDPKMDVLGINSRYVSCMITDHHKTFSIQWESNKDLGQVIDSLSTKASSSITVSESLKRQDEENCDRKCYN